jgi:hypothetical protein
MAPSVSTGESRPLVLADLHDSRGAVPGTENGFELVRHYGDALAERARLRERWGLVGSSRGG